MQISIFLRSQFHQTGGGNWLVAGRGDGETQGHAPPQVELLKRSTEAGTVSGGVGRECRATETWERCPSNLQGWRSLRSRWESLRAHMYWGKKSDLDLECDFYHVQNLG